MMPQSLQKGQAVLQEAPVAMSEDIEDDMAAAGLSGSRSPSPDAPQQEVTGTSSLQGTATVPEVSALVHAYCCTCNMFCFWPGCTTSTR